MATSIWDVGAIYAGMPQTFIDTQWNKQFSDPNAVSSLFSRIQSGTGLKQAFNEYDYIKKNMPETVAAFDPQFKYYDNVRGMMQHRINQTGGNIPINEVAVWMPIPDDVQQKAEENRKKLAYRAYAITSDEMAGETYQFVPEYTDFPAYYNIDDGNYYPASRGYAQKGYFDETGGVITGSNGIRYKPQYDINTGGITGYSSPDNIHTWIADSTRATASWNANGIPTPSVVKSGNASFFGGFAESLGGLVKDLGPVGQLAILYAATQLGPGVNSALGLSAGSAVGPAIASGLINTAVTGSFSKGLKAGLGSYLGAEAGAWAGGEAGAGNFGDFLKANPGYATMFVNNVTKGLVQNPDNLADVIKLSGIGIVADYASNQIPMLKGESPLVQNAVKQQITTALNSGKVDLTKSMQEIGLAGVAGYALSQMPSTGFDSLDPKTKSLIQANVTGLLKGQDLSKVNMNWAMTQADSAVQKAVTDNAAAVKEGWESLGEKTEAKDAGYTTPTSYKNYLNSETANKEAIKLGWPDAETQSTAELFGIKTPDAWKEYVDTSQQSTQHEATPQEIQDYLDKLGQTVTPLPEQPAPPTRPPVEPPVVTPEQPTAPPPESFYPPVPKESGKGYFDLNKMRYVEPPEGYRYVYEGESNSWNLVPDAPVQPTAPVEPPVVTPEQPPAPTTPPIDTGVPADDGTTDDIKEIIDIINKPTTPEVPPVEPPKETEPATPPAPEEKEPEPPVTPPVEPETPPVQPETPTPPEPPVPPTDEVPQCDAGFHWDGSMCVSDDDVQNPTTTCPEGYLFDLNTQSCVKIGGTTPITPKPPTTPTTPKPPTTPTTPTTPKPPTVPVTPTVPTTPTVPGTTTPINTVPTGTTPTAQSSANNLLQLLSAMNQPQTPTPLADIKYYYDFGDDLLSPRQMSGEKDKARFEFYDGGDVPDITVEDLIRMLK